MTPAMPRSALAACLLAVAALPVHAGEEIVTMEDRCRREVLELHQFFADWFNARLRDDEASFARFSKVMDEGFEIIGPDGKLTARQPLLEGLRAAHGKRPGISIEIREPRAHTVGEGLCLATYQEWQSTAETTRGWISTALMRRDDDAPNGVVWLRVHETYLPES